MFVLEVFRVKQPTKAEKQKNHFETFFFHFLDVLEDLKLPFKYHVYLFFLLTALHGKTSL